MWSYSATPRRRHQDLPENPLLKIVEDLFSQPFHSFLG